MTYQSIITEMSPMAEMVTIVERIGTMKEVRIWKINAVIQNQKKQREELLCLMMKTTDTGAKIMDITVEKEKDQNPEREPIIIQVQERRNKTTDTEMVQRNTERSTTVILTSTENPERTRTDEGRIPHTDENNT